MVNAEDSNGNSPHRRPKLNEGRSLEQFGFKPLQFGLVRRGRVDLWRDLRRQPKDIYGQESRHRRTARSYC